ncbi:MAG: hypothetical protein EOP24_31830, partial [Hyphomicrobiales bacterium]
MGDRMTTEFESIGLSMDTAGVERGIRSLDELAARGPKVEKSLKGVEAAATGAGKGVSSLGASNAKGLDDVAKAGDRAAEGLNKTSQAARSAVSSQQALAAAVAQFTNVERSYVQSLVDEYKQLSMGRAERAAYIAQSKGMSSAAQEVARAVGQKIEAHRKEQEEAKKAVASAESLGRAWNAVGNVIGGVAVAMAGNFSYRTFIRETIQAEQEQTQLQAVLRSTGESAGWSAQRLNEMADALSIKGGKSIFSSGEITQAQTRLLSYTGIVGEQLPRAMQNVIDMSSRMGMDLKSSAETIGRALDIPSEGLTALQRQGFRFTEAQKIMVKQLEETGRAGEAQAIVLQALESSYGGAAVAARDTFGGSLAGLKNNMNDLMTGEGGSVNAMKSGIEDLNSVLAADGTKQAFQTFVGWMAQVAAVSAKSAANLVAFIDTANKISVIAGTDTFGRSTVQAEAASRKLTQLVDKAIQKEEELRITRKRLAEEGIDPNADAGYQSMARGYEYLRGEIEKVRPQAEAASDALKQFAGGAASSAAAAAASVPQIEAQGAALGKSAEFVMKYGTASEKAAAAVAKARKEYGAAFTPEMQKQIEAFYAKQDKGANAAAAAMKTEQSAYQATVAAIQAKIAENAQELMYSGRLTESDKLRIKLMAELEAGAKTLTASHKADALALIEKLAAQERERDLIKQSVALYQQQAEIQAEIAADYIAQSKAREAGRQAVNDYAKGIQESNDALQYELSLMGLGEQAREVALEQYRIELELKKQIAAIDANSGFENEAQREAERARVRAAAAVAKANASSKVFLDNWKESIKQYDDIFRQGFADMLNNGEDGWKSFTKSLVTTFKTTVADQIYKMFLQPFVVKIVGQFLGISGAGGAFAGLAGGGSGGVSGLLNLASNVRTGYSELTGNGYVGNAYRAVTGWLGYGQAAPGLGLTSSGTGLGLSTGGGYGITGSSYGANTIGAGIGNSTAAGGAGTGASMFSGGGGSLAGFGAFAAVAALALNALGAFRSERIAGNGLTGTLGAGKDLQPYSLWREGGTLFSGPKYSSTSPGEEIARYEQEIKDLRAQGKGGTETVAGLEEQLQYLKDTYGEQIAAAKKQSDAIQATYDAMRTSVGDMADVLGISSEAVRKFTMAVGSDLIHPDTGGYGLNFSGLSQEEIIAKVDEALRTANNTLAEQVIGTWKTITEEVRRTTQVSYTMWGDNYEPAVYREDVETVTRQEYVQSEFARDGEKAIDTLTRLATSLTTVNSVFENLGTTLYASSLAGGDMASMLLDLFGGADNFAAATGTYFQNFFSPEEQRKAMQQQLQKQLDTLNLQLPDINAVDARAQYRALAEAQDLTTEAGRKAYAMLIQLAGAFAGVTAEGENAAAAEIERQKKVADQRFNIEQRLLIAQGKDREALDLRRQQEWDALSKLDPALAKMISQVWELEDAAQAVADKEAARSNAMRDLSDAMGRQTEIWENQLTALDTQRQLQQEALGLITGIFDLVRSNARDLYGEVQSTAAMQATQGNAFIAQALATAKRTGYLPEQDALQQAISGARSGLDNNNFASQVDADFARLVLAGQLKGLEE